MCSMSLQFRHTLRHHFFDANHNNEIKDADEMFRALLSQLAINQCSYTVLNKLEELGEFSFLKLWADDRTVKNV